MSVVDADNTTALHVHNLLVQHIAGQEYLTRTRRVGLQRSEGDAGAQAFLDEAVYVLPGNNEGVAAGGSAIATRSAYGYGYGDAALLGQCHGNTGDDGECLMAGDD
jgi:hypothetical protein